MTDEGLEPGAESYTLAHSKSAFWGFVTSIVSPALRAFAYVVLVALGVALTLPRIHDPWFRYSILAYPTVSIVVLELLRRTGAWLSEIRVVAHRLLGDSELTTSVEAPPDVARIARTVCVLGVGTILAALSLLLNKNLRWSRFTDALAVLYVGSMAGELAYHMLLIPWTFARLRRHKLRLNPLDPANTVAMRGLAEISLIAGLTAAVGLFIVNGTLALAAYYYRHLLPGVLALSAAAWATTIALTVYPHVVLFGLVQRAKAATLLALEQRLLALSDSILYANGDAGAAEPLLKLQEHVLGTKAFPVSNTAIYAATSTLILNSIPAVIGWFRQH
jgi:hypothetical protein